MFLPRIFRSLDSFKTSIFHDRADTRAMVIAQVRPEAYRVLEKQTWTQLDLRPTTNAE